MSSRISGRMRLRGLVLAGASVSMLQSCEILALGAAAHYVSTHDAAVIEANATRDAARINANSYGNANQQEVDVPSWEIFSCSGLKDFNNNGRIDCEKEIIDKGKTEFYVGESYAYVVKLLNCKGKELKFFAQNASSQEKKEISRVIIPHDAWIRVYKGNLTEPANWHAYVTLDDAKIGDYRITVREDPSRAIGKK